jgi:hypothetical protein
VIENPRKAEQKFQGSKALRSLALFDSSGSHEEVTRRKPFLHAFQSFPEGIYLAVRHTSGANALTHH